jgi:hypothetical protein
VEAVITGRLPIWADAGVAAQNTSKPAMAARKIMLASNTSSLSEP